MIGKRAKSQAEVAAYVSQLSGELAVLARGASLDSVAYFLDMARREAASFEQKDPAKGDKS